MKKIFFLAAASLLLTACDKNDDNPVPSDMAVKISATIGENYTTRAKDNDWSENDIIGITASSGFAVGRFVNMKYTKASDGNGFTGTPIYFYNPMTLTAYYPFTGEEGKLPGSDGVIGADTGVDNQKPESQPYIDFLYAAPTGISVKDNQPCINFEFKHKMSKLTFIFEDGNTETKVSKIVSYTVEGLVLDGTFNTADGVCTAKKDGIAGSITMNPGKVESKQPLEPLIVFPQTVDKLTIKIHDNEGQDYVGTLGFDNNRIEAGNNYQFTIKVSKTQLSVNSGINPWELIIKNDNEPAKSAD